MLIEDQQKVALIQRVEEYRFWKEYMDFLDTKEGKIFLNSPPYRKEFQVFKEFLEPIVSKLTEKQDIVEVLEIGCGRAFLIVRAMKEITKNFGFGMKAKVCASDIFLDGAKEKLEALGYFDVSLKKVDLREKLPFSDNSFDIIGASKVIQDIPFSQGKTGKEALVEIFKELYRILKPGGVLIWSFMRVDLNPVKGALKYMGYLLNPIEWIKARYFLPKYAIKMVKWAKPFREKLKKGIYHRITKEECEKLLLSVGFENPEFKLTFAEQFFVNKANKPFLL